TLEEHAPGLGERAEARLERLAVRTRAQRARAVRGDQDVRDGGRVGSLLFAGSGTLLGGCAHDGGRAPGVGHGFTIPPVSSKPTFSPSKALGFRQPGRRSVFRWPDPRRSARARRTRGTNGPDGGVDANARSPARGARRRYGPCVR